MVSNSWLLALNIAVAHGLNIVGKVRGCFVIVKNEKHALQKQAKFFVAKGTSLYYVGGGKQLNFILLCIDLLRSVYYVCIRGSAVFMLLR